MLKAATWRVFNRVKRYLRANGLSILVGAMAVPAFLQLTEMVAQRYLVYQKNRTHELLLRYKKQRMFEMMEENFEATFKKWFDLMKDTIKETLNAEKYAELLRNGEGNKMENWTEMKIIAYANILALVYGSSMLTIILRIQVNVISGLLFRQMEKIPPGLENMQRPDLRPWIITEEVQQEYMVLTRYLCTDGIENLCRIMYAKAKIVIENMSLKQKLTVGDMEQQLAAITNKELEHYQPINFNVAAGKDDAQRNDWCPITEAWFYMCSVDMIKQYLYPPENKWRTDTEAEMYVRTLIGESYDLVHSVDAKTLLKFLAAQGLNNYLDRISEFMNTLTPSYTESEDSQTSDAFASAESSEASFVEISAPIAKLIPVMNSFINVPFAEDTWASVLLHNESLKSYSANVYESYSSKDIYQT